MYISYMNYYTFTTTIGSITVGHRDEQLFSLSFSADTSYDDAISSFELEVKESVLSYLQGHTTLLGFSFSIEKLKGTPFQKSVWKAMCSISYGETKTYGELAKMIGNPRSSQAVGNACGANPLPLLIPCHRVVAQSGLGGFSAGLKIKEALLKLEGVLIL